MLFNQAGMIKDVSCQVICLSTKVYTIWFLCNATFSFQSMIPQVRIIASGLRPTAASLLRFSARAMSSVPATPSTSVGQTEENSNPTFASLMRNCKLTSMGNPVGQVVVGKVYHIVNDDLYIDFGHKFGCICKKPRYNLNNYWRKSNNLKICD